MADRCSYDQAVNDLCRQAQRQHLLSAEVRRFMQVKEEEHRNRQEQRKLEYQRNAMALRSQISLNLQRKLELKRQEQRPGIDPSFSGFPNIPKTPSALRRLKKRATQQTMKSLLEDQIRSNNLRRLRDKEMSMSTDMAINARIHQELQSQQRQISTKLIKQREEMMQFLKDTQSLKTLKGDLDASFSMLRTFDEKREVEESPQEDGNQTLPDEPEKCASVMSSENFLLDDTVTAAEASPAPITRPTIRPQPLSSLSVPEPTIQQYHPSDQRDSSLGGPKGPIVHTLPNLHATPIRGQEWSFATWEQPRVLRLGRPALVFKGKLAK